MMTYEELIAWLPEGDVSIQYQLKKDLLDTDDKDMQKRIGHEGWGKRFLDNRYPNGHWGQHYYQPKWISTHYTLLDLRNLLIAVDSPLIHETLRLVIAHEKSPDGGIYPIGTNGLSDVCVTGMA